MARRWREARDDRAGSGALRRTLGFTDLVMITLGTVIGSGIFLVPAVVLRQTGGTSKHRAARCGSSAGSSRFSAR